MRGWLLLTWMSVGCAAHTGHPSVSWDFHGRAVPGHVRVLPVVTLADAPELTRDSWLGAGIPSAREAMRRDRHRDLDLVPQALADALPGAVNAELGLDWGGEFSVGTYPLGTRAELRASLVGRGDLPASLSAIGRRSGGDAVLVTWVHTLTATPLSAEAFPGDIVQLPTGPVVVDHLVEPYRVTARVGAALVASDGDIVVRYVDTVDAVLDARGAHDAGRTLATELAGELAHVWPADPRLRERFAQR